MAGKKPKRPLRRGATGEMTDINSGKAWSEMDIRDLQNAIRRGETAEEIATFLCRDIDEVQAKITELRGQRPS